MINAPRRDLLETGEVVRNGPISENTDVSSSYQIPTSAFLKVGVKGWRVGDSAGKIAHFYTFGRSLVVSDASFVR